MCPQRQKSMKKEEDRNPELCKKFVQMGKIALSQCPELKNEWSIDDDEDHCILYIPKVSDDGFDIEVEVNSYGIIVTAEVTHIHFDREDDLEDLCKQALGLIRDMLSEGMRVLQKESNGKPYRWSIQSNSNGQWITEETSGIFFWNYFGKKSERIFTNHHLPIRINK